MRPIHWPVSCSHEGMIARFLLILASLAVIGTVAGYLMFVSPLSLLAAIVVGIGLLATLVLGYWAGSNSLDFKPRVPRLQKLSVINAPAPVDPFYQVTPIR